MTPHVIRQSALAHWYEASGARMIEYHGWSLPASFAERARVVESVGLADVSWITKLDLKGFGLKTPLAFPEARTWALGRRHVLVTCDPSARAATLASLDSLRSQAADLGPPPVYVTDVTSVYAQFILAGPRSRDVLGKLTSLNVSHRKLSDLGCAQASLAHVHSLLLRQDLHSVPAFHLLVTRDYAESVWESLLHAGSEFGIAPFGVETLAQLRALAT